MMTGPARQDERPRPLLQGVAGVSARRRSPCATGALRKASIARSPARRRRERSPTPTRTQQPADGADQPKELALISSKRQPRSRLAARPHQRFVHHVPAGALLVGAAHVGAELRVEKSQVDLLITSVARALLLR
jgi:hypothetical protein